MNRNEDPEEYPSYYEQNKERIKARTKKYYRKNAMRIKAKAKMKYKMTRGKASETRQKRYSTDEEWAERVRAYNRERQRRIRAEKKRNNAETN